MKLMLPKQVIYSRLLATGGIIAVILVGAVMVSLKFFYDSQQKIQTLQEENQMTQDKLSKIEKELASLKNQDQYKRNEALQKEIESINKEYKKAATSYEDFLSIQTDQKKREEFEKLFAQTLKYLADRNYASAGATLTRLSKSITDEKAKLITIDTTTQDILNVPTSNSAPNSGFSRQVVSTELGNFIVNIVAADLNSTKVIVDTAADSTCINDCPVLSLGDYVGRSGAYAGINGSYFCPASYPSCTGKTNSFDTLLMNKNKVYFNSENNQYSSVPIVAFYGNTARFMSRTSDWGRDTGVDGVIANQPLLLLNGQITFNGDGDPKKGGKGARSFVASKGSNIYIGVVQNATVAEVGYVLKAMGIENALNLDSGGSTALWSGEYKVGPGRNIPNAILFVRK